MVITLRKLYRFKDDCIRKKALLYKFFLNLVFQMIRNIRNKIKYSACFNKFMI